MNDNNDKKKVILKGGSVLGKEYAFAITGKGKIHVSELRKLGTTPLKQDVIRIIIENVDVKTDNTVDNSELRVWLSDVMQYGCIGGAVSGMVYYTETVPFYERHKGEINDLLTMSMADTGFGIAELFGERWDEDDPLALERFNQNLLAWFAFEETARNIAIELGMEI